LEGAINFLKEGGWPSAMLSFGWQTFETSEPVYQIRQKIILFVLNRIYVIYIFIWCTWSILF